MRKVILLCTFLLMFITLLIAQEPEWLWATQAGGTSYDYGRDITIDNDGNVYVVGSFWETATFGSYNLISSGDIDVFITKMDANGNYQWATQAGGTNMDIGFSIAIDDLGNSYITGCFSGTANFGPFTLTGTWGTKIFVAKIDASGNWLWVKQVVGSGYDDRGLDITIDDTGNIHIIGFFRDTKTFGTYTLTSVTGSDIFVAMMDSNGNWLWVEQISGPNLTNGDAIITDDAGNSYVTGGFEGSSNFGSFNLTSNGLSDIFVAKLDISGNWQWAVSVGDVSGDFGKSIEIDNNNNCYVTGSFLGTVNFVGSNSIISSGSADIFVAKIDNNGNWQWAIKAGSVDWDGGYNNITDDSGNNYVTGVFKNVATFGSHTLTSYGNYDIFVTKIDANGNWLWVTQAGGIDEDKGMGITIDDEGCCYITGGFCDVSYFDTHSITSNGSSDIFVAKLNDDLIAEFTSDITTGYVPLVVNFTDLSTLQNEIISWEWDFQNDGIFDSSVQNPTYTYLQTGIYDVKLRINDGANQDSLIINSYITVNPPEANFSVDTTTGYSPLNVTFSDQSLGNITFWEWDFQNDGVVDSYEQNPIYTYYQAGSYDVKLWVSDGTYSDSLIIINYISVTPPVANFTANTTTGYCPLNVTFSDQSLGNITSWEWDFDSDGTIDSYLQNPDFIYSEIGIYTVSLTVSDGFNTDTKVEENYITVEGPSADFIADVTTGYVPLEVEFTDLSVGNIISWEWDFQNDGTIDSFEENPIWIYEEPDIYSVSLTISDGINTDTELKEEYITVYIPLIAEFEANITSGVVPLEIQFTDLSTGNIIEWSWDFENDGTIDSNEQNPSWIYEESDIYTVSLTISDGINTDIETKVEYISVYDSLIAEFVADSTLGFAPLEVQFTDLSTHSQNPIIIWEWDFQNDGIIDSYLQNPIYTYSEAGIYTVSLTVSDGVDEDIEIKEDYITVIEPLDADFEADVTSGDAPLEVQFTDLSTGQILGWMWDFDNDGTIDSNEQNPIYTYNDAGVYTVSLTITDGSNEDTEIKEDYITVIFTGVYNEVIPLETKLYQNHPNPFNPVTNIQFDIKENKTGVLSIFNLKGQILKSQRFNSGRHDYAWNADKHGSGLYFYKLKTENIIQTKKMLLLK